MFYRLIEELIFLQFIRILSMHSINSLFDEPIKEGMEMLLSVYTLLILTRVVINASLALAVVILVSREDLELSHLFRPRMLDLERFKTNLRAVFFPNSSRHNFFPSPNHDDQNIGINHRIHSSKTLVTYQRHDKLKGSNFPEDWIPKQFLCPITLCIIDGTPVYSPTSPVRFNQQAILHWLKLNKTNPINRDLLFPNMLRTDYFLEKKIIFFVEWACLNTVLLKSLQTTTAQNQIDTFVRKIDVLFNDSTINPNHLVEICKSSIQNIISKKLLDELSNALMISIKEALTFKPATMFILSMYRTKLNFYQKSLIKIYASTNEFNANFKKQQNSGGMPHIVTGAFRPLALEYHSDKHLEDIAVKDKFMKFTNMRNIIFNKDKKKRRSVKNAEHVYSTPSTSRAQNEHEDVINNLSR
jgi:hypothetical protein